VNLNLFSRSRWTFEKPSGSSVTVEVGGSVQIDNDEAQRAIAIEGGGIAYLPFDLVERDLAEGRLQQILPGWRLPTMPIRVVYPSKRLMPRAVAAFVTKLAESLEPHSRRDRK
jgi:DNA-binding transcriptional LysR family regulator